MIVVNLKIINTEYEDYVIVDHPKKKKKTFNRRSSKNFQELSDLKFELLHLTGVKQ